MNKVACVLIAICVIFCLSACGSSTDQAGYADNPDNPGNPANPQPTILAAVEYLDFEDSLQTCTDVIIGQFVRALEYESYNELEFKVVETLKGSTSDDTIYVFEEHIGIGVVGTSYSYTSGTYNYVPGQKYLLVLERNISVYQEHDRYLQLSDIYIPLSSLSDSMIYNQDIRDHMKEPYKLSTEAELVSYVENIILQAENSRDYYGTEYSQSDDLATVISESGYILQVKVGELIVVGRFADTETYRCSLQETLQGDWSYLTKEDLDSGIVVVFPRGTVSPGGEYIVLLNKVDANSLIFVLSSRISILQMSEKSFVCELLKPYVN